MVWVGEVFYRFSGYALLQFENMLDSLKTITNYKTEGGRNVIEIINQNLGNLTKKIAEENITITAADIFFNVNGADEASKLMSKIKHAQALFMENISLPASDDEITRSFEQLKETIAEQIVVIKNDRNEIKNRIQEVLRLNKLNNKEK